MKPLKLELQAFGPFVEKQTVDFETLGKNGVFLIKGKTGSGKTTLFDAMTFALYGGASGEAENVKQGRNDLTEWRCTQAPWDIPTYVAFTFESHGKRYYFKRTLTPKRTNLSESYEAGELTDEGVCVPFFENPKATLLKSKAEELIGLTKDQFRQVVLLPQGQFERFLTEDSDKKTLILQKIFGTEQWNVYAQNFYYAAKRTRDALTEEKTKVDTALAEEDLTDLDGLEEKIAALVRAAAENEQKHKEFNGPEKQKSLNSDRALAEQFRQKRAFEARCGELERQREEIGRKRAVLVSAEKAETLRETLGAFDRAAAEEKSRKAAAETAAAALPAAEKTAAETKQTLEKAAADSPVAELTKRIGGYTEKRPLYETLNALRLDGIQKKAAHKAAADLADAAAKKLEEVTLRAKQGKERFDAADAESKRCRDAYFAGIYGEIAAGLQPEIPCPVCGSRAHPAPAKKAPGSVGKDDMKRAEALAEAAKKQWEAAETARAEAQEAQKKADAEKQKKYDALSEAAAAFKAAQENLIPGIADLQALDAAVAALHAQTENYEAQIKRLQAKSQQAADALSAAKTRAASAKEDAQKAAAALKEAGTTLAAALAAHGGSIDSVRAALLPPQTRAALQRETAGYEAACKEAEANLRQKQTELADAAAPDETQFDLRQTLIDQEQRDFVRNDAALKNEADRLKKKQAWLGELYAHYSANIHQADSDLAFAKKLRGESGIGLQRYVLAVMFSQVIGEANRMLEQVHGGRYRLFRTDDKGEGNKRGLELKVFDSRSPSKEGRSVSLLSGGEKFLVSLSLSIGLSAVAQRSGVQIEALFIDEGFGTLDETSVEDAMRVLDSVRKGNGMIGIISHVQMLESNITTHLEVVKTEEGSYLRME